MMAVVDYGVGNLGSIANMLRKAEVEHVVSADPSELARADRLVLPGVGAFDRAMEALDERGLHAVLDDLVLEREVPVLGICLGMQLLARSSEEGERRGLAWLDADVRRIVVPSDSGLKVPHMGWNTIRATKRCALLPESPPVPRFYFVHSFHMVCDHSEDVAATANHGSDLTAAVARGNVYGVQFHPEKSHRYGLELFSRFATMSHPSEVT